MKNRAALALLHVTLFLPGLVYSWVPTLSRGWAKPKLPLALPSHETLQRLRCTQRKQLGMTTDGDSNEQQLQQSIDFDSLMEMDCVVFSRPGKDELELGVVEENHLQPICAWTTDEAFDDFIEFVVDEEDRFTVDVEKDGIVIHSLIPNECLSFGSRQVGGGKGPGNPHGEESELLYYIQQEALEGIKVTVKPELEILW